LLLAPAFDLARSELRPADARLGRASILSLFYQASIDVPPACHPITRIVPLAHAVLAGSSLSITQLFPSAHAGLLLATESTPMDHAQLVVLVPFNHAPPQMRPVRSRGMTLVYEVRATASRIPRTIFRFNHARQIQTRPNTAGN
jgi:hypothetical protein